MIGLIALFLMSFGTGGLLYAREQRRNAREEARLRLEAEDQFKDARNVIDFMLLRVGREDLAHEPRMKQVRRGLLDPAMGFYEKFLRADKPSPQVRHAVAWAARAVGDIHTFLDRTQEAEQSYARALSLLDELAADTPQEPRYREDIAATCVNFAKLLKRLR